MKKTIIDIPSKDLYLFLPNKNKISGNIKIMPKNNKTKKENNDSFSEKPSLNTIKIAIKK